MAKLVKNVDQGVPFEMAGLVDYEEGTISSLTLSQTKGVGITVFALAKGEEIGAHAAPGDAMVLILDGEAEIRIDGNLSIVKKGESIIMPRDIPHALRASVAFKMLLTVVNEV